MAYTTLLIFLILVATAVVLVGNSSNYFNLPSTEIPTGEVVSASKKFDFTILVNPNSGTVEAGKSLDATVTATLRSGKAQNVKFSCGQWGKSKFPSGVECSFTRTECKPTCTSSLTIQTSSSTPEGKYTIKVIGKAGSKEKGAAFTLTITEKSVAACDFGIQVNGFSQNGKIKNGDRIQVVYKPTTTNFLKAGTKISLPNNYVDLGYEGFNTDKFVGITVQPVTGITAYDKANPSKLIGIGLAGLQISADVAKSINGYDKAYALIDKVTTKNEYPVMIGFQDSKLGKVLVEKIMYPTTDKTTTFDTLVRYANDDEPYSMFIDFLTDDSPVILIGGQTRAVFHAKTTWDTNSIPEFKLGNSTAKAESSEIQSTTEGIKYEIGDSTNDVVDDLGWIIVNPAKNSLNDKIIYKIPSKELKAKVYFGKIEGGSTCNEMTCWGWAALVGTEKEVGLSDKLKTAFPSNGIMTPANSNYPGLKDSTFSWKGADYDYYEQVSISEVQMRHDYSLDQVKGSLKMVAESGDVVYEYFFDENLNLDVNGKGTITNPEYANPVKITILGRDIFVVGVGNSQIKILIGSIGTATATSGVKFGDYTVYSDKGSDNEWAQVTIKDSRGRTVDTLTIDDPDRRNAVDAKDSTKTGLRIKVINVVALQDGTIVGTDLIVGSTADGIEKTYDGSADTASTGGASDCFR